MWTRVWQEDPRRSTNQVVSEETGVMAKFTPPENFNFSSPVECFARYRTATKLNKDDEEVQVSALIYAMGKQAEHKIIFKSFTFTTEGDEAKNGTVLEKFDQYVVPKRNVIHERARFHIIIQSPGESIEAFVRALYEIAENCDFTTKDEQIRDRLVIGISDKNISEKLQMKPDLTLDTAVQTARQAELVKSQMKEQGHKMVEEVRRVNNVKGQRTPYKSRPKQQRAVQQHKQSHQQAGSTCTRCNRVHGAADMCPAFGTRCKECNRSNHFAVCCRSESTQKQVREVVYETENQQPYFLGSINTTRADNGEPWRVTLRVVQTPVTMKIDSGADISIISETTYNELQKRPTLSVVSSTLQSPGGKLITIGKFKANIKYKGKQYEFDVYVVRGTEANNLLGRNEAVQMGLITRLDKVTIDKEVFGTTGLVKCEPVSIKMKPDISPYCLTTARRVPFPIMKKVEEELTRMEKDGIIEKVTEPSDWCAPMVPVIKKNGNVRICVDLKKLNESVKREHLMLPALDDISPKLVGAIVFSKLDASSGFYQIPLHPDSFRLTTFITPYGRFCF